MDFRYIANFINSPGSAEDLPVSSPLSEDDVIHIKTEHPDRPLCSGCGAVIYDRWMLHAGDQPFHLSCLRCSVCLLTLDKHSSCYIRDGAVYCKYHYLRVFRERCAACTEVLEATDWVRFVRDSIFHVSCFVCSDCGLQLSTGDEFMMRESSLLCRAHGLLALRNEMDDTDIRTVSADHDDSVLPRKRARSSFTKDQLALLHAHFRENPTPSSTDIHQLAALTGHPYRVIQIWFQNARARSKKPGRSNSDAFSDGMASSPWSVDLNSPESQHSESQHSLSE